MTTLKCTINTKNRLFREVIRKVSQHTGLPEKAIMDPNLSIRRRRLHDDITILVVDLEGQV